VQHTVSRFAAVVGVAGAFAIASSTADAMTVRVGDPTLIGRVALSVPVSVSCAPFDASYTLVSTGVSVRRAGSRGHRDCCLG
jgi:hypothetical protein